MADRSPYLRPLDGFYKCPTCDNSFAYLSWALRHQKCHAADRDLHCNLCMCSFKHEASLHRHMTTAHASHTAHQPSKTSSKQVRESEARGNPCPECYRNFASWNNLQKHQKSVHGKHDRPMCDECGMRLS
ncbi:zinc finger protein 648, partial [Clonorchis sinensis]